MRAITLQEEGDKLVRSAFRLSERVEVQKNLTPSNKDIPLGPSFKVRGLKILLSM